MMSQTIRQCAITFMVLLICGHVSMAADSKPSSSSSPSGSSSGSSSTGSSSVTSSSGSSSVPSRSATLSSRAPPRIPPMPPMPKIPTWSEFSSRPSFILRQPLSSTNANFFSLSSVARRKHTVKYQVPPGADPAKAEIVNPKEKIMIPIGISNYKPIQFIDTVESTKKSEFPDFSFFSSPREQRSTNSVDNSTTPKNNEKRQATPATATIAPPSKPVSAKPVLDSPVPVSVPEATLEHVDPSANTILTGPNFRHKPRMIELESSYIPLTLRFTTRPRKLNILANDNDLVGQDSNRHDRINGKKEPIDIIDLNSGSFNLDPRTIFGKPKEAEPLVLKPGQQSGIPSNMQSIIKCIFPDFQFEGAEKIRSAC